MHLIAPEEIEHHASATHLAPALFGYISSLPDRQFLQYVICHRSHKVIRRVFFSEIQKRSELDVDAVDLISEALLTAVEDRMNRSSDETLIRHLFPHMSMQMRTRAFKLIFQSGTKTAQAYFLRKSNPETTPGIEETVFTEAMRGNEDALVGIVYRWPLSAWKERAIDLFGAAARFPWLQRQIIFKSDAPDIFLDRNLIKDPVTELYIRARYRRQASYDLMDSAIRSVNNERRNYESGDRIGLVAWCLGHYGAFDRLQTLARSSQMGLPEKADGLPEPLRP
jgi:hypothetical protein